MKKFIIYFAVFVVVLAVAVTLFMSQLANKVPSLQSTAQYIGAESCVQCHQQQYNDWQGSHHDMAMQHVTDASILADFNNTQFEHQNVTSTFYKKGDKYFIKTDGPDGQLSEYQIKYTFGIEPLQQYLVELEGGRLQALSIAWDSRSVEEGGQRWFHLYPDEKIDYKDELHWTKLSQNWNHMCADCHSTNLKKNFDIASNSYSTTWSEINVACEACHGPASNHVAWANKREGWQSQTQKGLVVLLNEREGVSWQFNATSRTAKRSQVRHSTKEIDSCAQCHARRSPLVGDYSHGKPLEDNYLPALLTERLYYPDGQIKDEVYVYGSFLQSKMFHNGVTCSDCHEPHSLKLRAEGNQVCLQCHQADQFDTEQHHFHSLNSEGASCAECHMPASNFMVIDARHDHSIRIPRPDLSISIGTPNACNQCHTDKTPQWANTKMQKWYGKDWSPGWHFGETLFEARQGKPQIGHDLVAIAASVKLSDIARATATSFLPNYIDRVTLVVLPKLLSDKSASIRQAALLTVDNLEIQHRWRLAGDLLTDRVLAVRIEAARVLAVIDRDTLTVQQRQLLDKALDEYIAVQQANAEHPQSHINSGLVYLRLGKFEQAEQSYQQALKLNPNYVAAYVNLADLYRLQQLHDKAEAILLKARTHIGQNSDVEHALGLHFIRREETTKALAALALAARLQSGNVRYSYIYAVALYDNGQRHEAVKALEKAHALHPYNADVLIALVSYLQALDDVAAATVYAEKLLEIRPFDGNIQQLLQQLSLR